MNKLNIKKQIDKLELTYVSIDTLKPYKNNSRKHSPKQIQQLANCISEIGFVVPILVDEDNTMIAGHCRYAAATKLKLSEVPVIITTHLSQSQIKAFVIADNKIAFNASWDKEMLKTELQAINLQTKFDIELTGFEMAEIDIILDDAVEDETDEDDIPELDNKPAITQLGDIWILGDHILFCGDALLQESYKELLGKMRADIVVTDPPYNVKIQGHVCGNGKVKHSEFAMASGEMSDGEFVDFLKTSCSNMVKYSRDGSIHYIFMDWRHIDALIRAGKLTYSELKNICIWNKDNGGMGSLYRSKHEMIAVFKNGSAPHVNNIELGKHGRYRTNVWDYKGVNSFGRNQKDLAMHPTVKPVAMIADAIKDCSKRGDIVLDPFAGSGSTLIATEKTGRKAYCIELDPKYCDVIIKRWQNLTGQDAYHADSFSSFDEIQTSNF